MEGSGLRAGTHTVRPDLAAVRFTRSPPSAPPAAVVVAVHLGARDGKVEILESCFIAPSELTPTKGLWLCPLDLTMANRGHTPLVYFYDHPNNGTGDAGGYVLDVERLKESLAKALVAFYPLAGRLDVDNNGRMQINCNNEGALFVVARIDLRVDEFNDLKPSPELRRQFVPRVEPPSVLLAVQLTFFKCGGLALGLAVHHVAFDAMSVCHFIQTWSAISKDGEGAAVELPCHDRTLLRARCPPVIRPDALSIFCPTVNFTETSAPTATETFPITHYQLASLKRRCGGASTFCAVSALVWQCTCLSRRLPPDVEVRLSFPVNVRRRTKLPIPDRYFGNAFVWLGTTCMSRDIASKTLASVAGDISSTIRQMDDELVLSAMDYLELMASNKTDSGRRPLKGSMPAMELRINSLLGMPIYDADLGWGKARAVSRAESVRGGFVYLMEAGPADDKDRCAVRVLMCMEAANIREFERLLYTNLKRLLYANL